MHMSKRPKDSSERPDDFTLLDLWGAAWKRRKFILYLFVVVLSLAAVISLLTTPIYQAKATLMAVESSSNSLSPTLGTLQNLPVGGFAGGGFGKSATDKLVSILNSRTVAENVIQKLDLMKDIFPDDWDGNKGAWKTHEPPALQDALRTLQDEMVGIGDDRRGVISVSAEHARPNIAADIANEYTAALQKFLNENAISMAKRNRIFLGKQIETTKTDLSRAEEDLKKYQTEKKVVVMDAQAEGSIRALADLKAQIIAREVQLSGMGEFATKAHPEVMRLEEEARELRQQLRRLENGSEKQRKDESLGAFITLAAAPGVGLVYSRLKRDALIQQKVYELLIQQYEMAKIEEARDEITFQVIDPAIPPDKRFKPRRVLIMAVAGVASLFLGIFLALSLEFIDRQRSGNPQ